MNDKSYSTDNKPVILALVPQNYPIDSASTAKSGGLGIKERTKGNAQVATWPKHGMHSVNVVNDAR